jgi:phage baseplate assembly protein W
MAITYDIHYQPVPEGEVYGTKCFEFGYQSALKTRGLQALVNRWARIFLTPRGSDLLEPTSGTAIAGLIGNNISRLTTEVKDAVAIAIDETNAQVRSQDVEGFYPEDERLQNAYLVAYEPATSGFNIWVHIANVLGDSLEVPLTQLSMR